MSKDIIVLTPNGRRQKVHCSPDTSILQVLEDVCRKQGFQPSEYDLKHHNHLLDLTTTVRFSNLPNKATLEMVEAERKRKETNVTIGLLLEDGERRMADFSPNTSLFNLITSLAPSELNSFQHPSILYMRQEVTGIPALRVTTLRQLGLIGGRAILRLLNKAEEAKQANVSAVYRRPAVEKYIVPANNCTTTSDANEVPTAGPSEIKKLNHETIDHIQLIKNAKYALKTQIHEETTNITEPNSIDLSGPNRVTSKEDLIQKEQLQLDVKKNSSLNTSMSQEILERRLKIEEEVTFLGTQKSIAFMQPDDLEDELDDLPDEFYDLSIEEVRKLYHDLQKHRIQLENTPLLTSSKRDEVESQVSQRKVNTYKNVVVRVQFPDHIILQGIFSPLDTIQDINNFIKEHLEMSEKPFDIFTTPLKESLDPKMTLLDAKFVPCVHMHFKWVEDVAKLPYLKEQMYKNITSSDAASILASKYRAPSRRKMDSADTSQTPSKSPASTSKDSKVPKWFRNKD